MADCLDCNYMDLNDRNKYDEAYCSWMKKYISLTGSCYHFDRRESEYRVCYLTTMFCEILELEDDCDELETLRGYRDWYMLNDPSCKLLLEEYDTIGPILANKLFYDKEKMNVVKEMGESYIYPAIRFIFEEKYEEAKEIYIKMVNMLKQRYIPNKVKRKKR